MVRTGWCTVEKPSRCRSSGGRDLPRLVGHQPRRSSQGAALQPPRDQHHVRACRFQIVHGNRTRSVPPHPHEWPGYRQSCRFGARRFRGEEGVGCSIEEGPNRKRRSHHWKNRLPTPISRARRRGWLQQMWSCNRRSRRKFSAKRRWRLSKMREEVPLPTQRSQEPKSSDGQVGPVGSHLVDDKQLEFRDAMDMSDEESVSAITGLITRGLARMASFIPPPSTLSNMVA